MGFKPLGLEDVIPFGKFKGTKIRVLLMNELSYMEWVCQNITTFNLDEQASGKMESQQLIQQDSNWGKD